MPRPLPLRALAPAVLALTLAAAPAAAEPANAGVALRDGYAEGVHYATVTRGGITEQLFVAPEAIAAAKAGDPFPEGTVITMEDHRAGALHRVLVMEKRAEWQNASEAGGWLFREFDASGAPNLSEEGLGCQSCHASQAEADYVFTRDRMLDD